MIAAERHLRILEMARRDGTVRTAELAVEFEVNEETIRRDLDGLARKGRLRRMHGGAVDATILLGEPTQTEREARQLEEKISIAREAAKLVKEGETLLLDASSTALQLASCLPQNSGLRIVTYAQAVIDRLAVREDIELVQLGGIYDRRGRRYSGLLTEMTLRALRIDRFFFSGGGYDPKLGVGEPNPEQARLKRMMLEHAAWSCALLDHTKLGAPTDQFFAKPGDLAALVTDKAAAAYAKTHLKDAPFSLHFSG